MATPKLIKTDVPGIYKRGKSYVVTFRADGKQRREHCKSMPQAKKLKAMRTADVARGEFHEQTRTTFKEYASEWIERYQGAGRGFRESTREDYRRDLERYAYPFMGRVRLTQITPSMMAKWVGWLCDEREHGRRFADRSIRRIVGPVRSCLATAVREGLIRYSPARDIALPNRAQITEDGEEVKAFSREQLAAILRVAHPRYRLFFKLLAGTGLRISEAIALEWRHLKLDGSEPHVQVRQQLYRGRLTPPKSKYGRRNVPIDARLVQELRRHRMESEWPEDENLVFTSVAGTALNADNLRKRVLAPAAEEVGAPWAGFHSFRHTFASMLFERGANAVQVQRLLGHHSASFTLSVYVHLLGDSLGEPLALDDELADNKWTTDPDDIGLDAEPTALTEAA